MTGYVLGSDYNDDEGNHFTYTSSNISTKIKVIKPGKYTLKGLWEKVYGTMPNSPLYPDYIYSDESGAYPVIDAVLKLQAVYEKDTSTPTISYSVTYNNTPTIVDAKGSSTVVAYSGVSTGINQLHQDNAQSATSGSLWTNTAKAPTSTDTGYTGYTWAGWYRYSGGTYTLVSDLSTINAGSAPADGGAYVLYGLWARTPQTYEITYTLDSGTNASTNPSTYTIETATITLDDPSRDGYTFLGWTGSNGTNPQKNVQITKGSTGDKAYTANWQKATYTVKFVDSDGTTALATSYGTTHEYKPTDATVAVPSSTKTGYTFSGWTLPDNTMSTATGGLGSWRGTAGETYTLKANWTANTYTINWNATWGNSSASDDVAATSTMAYGTSGATVMSTKPTALKDYVAGYIKDGYKLTGWYFTKTGTTWKGSGTGTAIGNQTIKDVVDGKASGTSPYSGFYLSGTTLNVYAVWAKLSSFNMTYFQNTDGKGGGNNATGTSTITQGDKYKVGSDAPNSTRTRKGYTLSGWNSQADGKGTPYTDGQELTNVTGTMPFYAQWTANTYKVSFNANNGSGTMADQLMTYDQSVNLTANAFSRTGNTFNGWNTQADGKGTAYVDKASVKNLTSTKDAVIPLYAQWKEILYSVHYHDNVTDSSVTFTKNDATGTVASSDYEYKKSGKSANWSGTDTNSGNGFGKPDVTASRSWYNFKHWSTKYDDSTGAVDATKPLSSLVAAGKYKLDLYAIWDAITVTVEYITDGHGTVDGKTSKSGSVTVSEVVDLATGASTKGTSKATAPQGATAAATTVDTAAGYVLKNPVWTDATGATVTVATNTDAAIKPTLAELRTLSNSGKTSTLTFRANFELGSFVYTVEAYLQKADGSYDSTTWKTLSQTQVPAFKVTYGTKVNADTDSVAFNGTNTLIKDIPLTQTTDGQTASALYEYDGNKTKADGVEELTVGTKGNVLKLYFKRLTYDLYAYFNTVDAKKNSTSGSPASATGVNAPATYAGVSESGHTVSPADTNHALTGLRWGQKVTLSDPSATGYTFVWAATDPARTGNLSGSFTLTAAEMAALTSKTANVTGTFTVETYTVTLKDTSTMSTRRWSNDAAGNTLASGTDATTTVAADDSLGSWVPTGVDDDKYYFAGWVKDGDDSKKLLQPSDLAAINTWTGNATYIAQWGKKVVIVYSVGASDSYGNAIADGWTTSSVSLSGANVGSDKYVGTGGATGPASFQTVTGQALVSGAPKAKSGWTFAGWKVSGTNGASTTKTFKQAEIEATGSSSSFALNANYSYTFTAQWTPDDAKVIFSNAGKVSNNKTVGDYTITVTVPNTNADGTPNPAWVAGASAGATTFRVDEKVDLSKYQPKAPAGYTFAGWTDGTNTYTSTDTATKGIPATGSLTLTLTPLFTENHVTFTYTAATGGSVSGTATDTVFAVKHNKITSHTTTASTSTGYEFDKWTCSVGGATPTDVTTATAGTLAEADMGIAVGDVLTANRTYTANFKLRDIDIVFAAQGTDGTTVMGTVTTPGSTLHTVTVKYGAKIPAGSVTVTEPYGYELVGWDWTDGTNSGTVTGTATDTQGIFAKAWTSAAKSITVTAKFAVDNTGKYTVKYDYDHAGTLGTSGYTSGDSSRANVAWGASGDAILPVSNPSANPPAKAGYNFEGWYTDSDFKQKVNGYTFGEIYEGKKGSTNIAHSGYGKDASTNLPYITLYGKWSAQEFTVYFDTYGKDVNGVSLSKGSSTDVTPDTIAKSEHVKWADDSLRPTANPTRGGYNFKGWTVQATKGGTTAETLGWVARTDGANAGLYGVQANDTYGALAGNDTDYKSITLVARWEAVACDVVYDYADGTRSNYIVSRKWDEIVDYYNDPATSAAPVRSDYSFSGWTYKYKTATGEVSGTLSKSTMTTLAALRSNDADTQSIVDANGKPLYLTLTANWSHDRQYQFQDVLVPYGMSKADAVTNKKFGTARGTYTLTGGETSVKLSTDYVGDFTGATTAYAKQGYDYDSTWATANDTQTLLNDSTLNTVYVYFVERTYQIDYYGSESDATGSATPLASMSDNPWSSAKVTLPASSVEPSRAGYTFDGWYTKDGGSEIKLGKTSDTAGALVSIEGVFGTNHAPATANAIKAYAKFSPVTATIAWSANAGGSVNPTAGSVTRDAADTTNAVAAITATPNTNYDFTGWDYSYTDESGNTKTGTLAKGGTAAFATLSSDGLTLTPQPWAMTGTTKLWHTITFNATFAPSGSITVTVYHLYQDVNKTGDAQWNGSSNTSKNYVGIADGVKADNDFDAEPKAMPKTGWTLVTDGSTFTAAAGKPFGMKKKIDPDDSTTLEFWLYYTAVNQNLTYLFVDASGNVVSAGSDAVPATATLPTGGTFKSGKTITIPADEDKTGAVSGWTFDGWHVGTPKGTAYAKGDLVSGSTDQPYTMPGTALVLVGTWSRITHNVKFEQLGTEDPAVAEGVTVTASPATLNVNDGEQVKQATNAASKSGTPAVATSLSDLSVTYSNNGKGYYLAGWYVYQDKGAGYVPVDASGNQVSDKTDSVIGVDDPLTRVITADTKFIALWAKSFAVTYAPGTHGTFTAVVYDGLEKDAALATDAPAPSSTPCNDGWEFVGWGTNDGSAWTYYFDYDAHVDYGATVADYGTTHGTLTGYKVSKDVTFTAFYKALKRTMTYHLTEADGTEAGKAYKPAASFDGSTDANLSTDVYTGDKPLLKSDVKRDGYDLTGWKVMYGGTVYATVYGKNTSTFQIPEVAGGTVIHLYPVFAAGELDITYKVDDACKTGTAFWGTLDNSGEKAASGSVAGSTPTAKDGYEFVRWEKDGAAGTAITDATYNATTHKLTPTASGTYVAVFKQKDYKFTADKGIVETATDTVTMPTGTQVSDTQTTPLHWTDTLGLAAYGKPTRAGYTFKGWDTYAADDWDAAAHAAKAGKTALRQGIKGDALISALSDAKGTATEIVLVATWDEVSDFQVEFDKNAGSDAVTDMPANQPSLKWGSPVDLKAKDGSAYKAPARAGFTFQGWTVYSDAAHATVLGGTDTTPVTANSDVYSTLAVSDANKHLYLVANWHEVDDYQVEFDKNAGTDTVTDMPANQTDLKWGSAVDLMAKDGTTYKGDPARDGYDFQGWTVYSDAAHTTVLGSTDTAHVKSTSSLYKNLAVSDANKHLYLVANWTKATLGVEYHLSGKGIWVADGSKYPSGDPMNTTYAAGKEEDKFNAQIGDTINLRGTDTVTYAGHTLLGWSAKPGATTPDAAYDLASKTSFSMPGKSVVLYAVWEDKTGYEVTFQANDSTDEPVTAGTMPADVSKADNLKFADTVATKVVVSGAAVDPERPGYTFLGWTVYADAAHTKVVNNTDQAANYLKGASYAYSALTNNDDLSHVWLVANWQDKGSDYKVTYDANDSDGATKVTASTMPAAWTGKFHGTGVKLDAPTRKGYTFLYWESSVTGNPHVSASSTATSYDALAGKDTVSSVVLKAIWKAEKIFNVVYNDGGAGTDLTSALPKGRANITFDAKDVKMDAQTRTGFSFAGWQAYDTTTVTDLAKAPKLGSVIKTYTDAVYSALAGGDDKVTTITLVAQWLGNKHYLTYDKGDASAVWSTTASYYPADDPVADGTYTTSEQGKAIETAYNASINLRGASTLALTGKTLIGWQTKDGATKYYLSDAPDGVATVASFTMPDKDLVLVPIWKVASGYSVTFLDRPASDKGTDAVTDMPVSPQSNLAWPGNVDLQAKDGSAYKGAPVRVGYTFEGWEIQDSKGVTLGSTSKTDTNAAFNDLADNKDTADRKALVLVARWTAVSDYNVVFKANDGVAGDGTTKVTAGTMPADRSNIVYATTGIDVSDPTRPGYIFEGWTSSVSGADVAAGTAKADYATLAGGKDVKTVTLTAKWKADETYSVTYDDGVPSGETGLDTATPLPAPRANIGYDAKDVKVSELKRDGYEFKGWDVYETADMNNWLGDITSAYATDRVYSALANSASVKGITLVAKWEAATNKVTYHLTSGQGTWSADTSKYPAKDKGAASPADPTGYQTGEKVYLRGGATIDRPGYTLRGWSKTAPADPLTATPDYDTTISYFTMPAGDVDLYPVWTAVKYRVTFKDKDASDTDSANAVTGLPSGLSSINYDDSVVAGSATEPKAPTRPGYDFAGWVVTDDNAGNAVLGGTDTTHVGAGTYTYAQLAKDPSVRAITLTAQWTKQQFEVRYYNINSTGSAEPLWTGTATDGGVLRADGSVSVAYETGDAVALREASTVSWAGHTLKGWATGTDKTATGYTEYLFDGSGKAGFTMPADNVYLYPIWDEAKDYAVKYVANQPTVADGAVVGKSVTGMPTDKSGLSWTTLVSTAHPAFAGFKFLGWVVTGIDNQVAGGYDGNNPYTGSDAFFNVLAGNKDTAAHKTLTLTAKWALDLVYNVIFKDGVPTGETAVDAGTMPAPQKGIAYTAKVDHTAPTRAGYKFTGWTVVDVTDPDNTHSLADRKGGTTSYYVLTGTPDFPSYKTLEMTANWQKRNDYNVHFVAGDGTTGDGLTKVTAVTMPTDALGIAWDDWFGADAPTREGYTFLGWDVKNTTGGASDQISDPKTPATAGKYQYSKVAYNVTAKKYDDTYTDLTFTALWKALSHDVTYVISGFADASWVKANITDKGKNAPDAAIAYDMDDSVILRGATTVTRNGYTLTGWANGTDATAAGYKEYVFANGDTAFAMPNADVKLYPLWTGKTYQVTYDANTGALSLTDPSQVVSGLHDPNPITGLSWTSDVPVDALTLPGYKFLGWVVKDAKETGALTGTLTKAAYTYDELARTDTAAHAALTLVAQWEQATYRLIYVDPVDADGAAAATPVQISNDATKHWGDKVDATTNPITGKAPWYTGKSDDDWQFDGWQVYDAATSSYVTLTADQLYSYLADVENLTLADVAGATDDPAVILYASWTRRVPFVVDFVKRPTAGTEKVESSTTLKGLDGDDIATKWASEVLDLGDKHAIAGYAYNRLSSTPGIVGTLVAGADELHLKLYYDPTQDYLVTYDATPGKNAAGKTSANAASPAWETSDASFAPVDSDWYYQGHKIDHWFYKGADGKDHTFDATDGRTFADIAAIIYGKVDGSEGRDADGDGVVDAKPVTLYAYWVERDDYKVVYNDNYDPSFDNDVEDKFLGRVKDATYTPADRQNVTWSSTAIQPTDTTGTIKEPGVTGGMALYEQDGWNYSTDGGLTQHPAEGMSFAQIAQAMFGTSEPDAGTIVLYARWKQVDIKLTYTPVIATVDADGKFQAVTGTKAGGTVSRASETVSAISGCTLTGSDLKAAGATATAGRGYHFIGWRRVSDGTVVYAPGYDPASLSTMSLTAMSDGTGFNVLPDGTIDGGTIFSVAQNASDGYWHSEEYQALFVENDPAVLHYDKNADDATGTIADVTKPYGTLIKLDSGTEDATADTTDGFKRAHWKLTGWNTKADGTGTPYALSQADWEMPKGETTLYAMWEKISGRLIYDKNATDATGTIADVVKQGGTVITLDSGTEDTTADTTDGFHRKHYVLVGWNTKADYTGTHYDLSESGWVMPDGTTTLYAEWQKAKYEISGPEGTDVVIPDGGDGTKTDGGTTGGTTGTKIDGGYIKGGDVTKIEYGEPVPAGWIEAIPEDGKHVDHWTYVWTDEDGTVHTETADDPTKFTVKGNGTISPVFVDDAAEEPETPVTPATPAEPSAPTTTAAAHTAPAAGETIPQTSDTFDALLPLTAAGLGLLLILLAFVTRRRDDEEAE